MPNGQHSTSYQPGVYTARGFLPINTPEGWAMVERMVESGQLPAEAVLYQSAMEAPSVAPTGTPISTPTGAPTGQPSIQDIGDYLMASQQTFQRPAITGQPEAPTIPPGVSVAPLPNVGGFGGFGFPDLAAMVQQRMKEGTPVQVMTPEGGRMPIGQAPKGEYGAGGYMQFGGGPMTLMQRGEPAPEREMPDISAIMENPPALMQRLESVMGERGMALDQRQRLRAALAHLLTQGGFDPGIANEYVRQGGLTAEGVNRMISGAYQQQRARKFALSQTFLREQLERGRQRPSRPLSLELGTLSIIADKTKKKGFALIDEQGNVQFLKIRGGGKFRREPENLWEKGKLSENDFFTYDRRTGQMSVGYGPTRPGTQGPPLRKMARTPQAQQGGMPGFQMPTMTPPNAPTENEYDLIMRRLRR